MKSTALVFNWFVLVFLAVSCSYADTISYGNGRFLFSVNGGLEIDAEKLDGKWHQRARSLCKDTKYEFYLFPVYINEGGYRATLIIRDRETNGLNITRNSEIKLKGALSC